MAAGEEGVLAATARSGFLQPATIAAVLGLEERLLIELVDRLGGEVHLPAFGARLAEPSPKALQAELADDGTYVIRTIDAG